MVVFSKDGMLYTSGSVSKAIPARIPINGPKAKRTMRTKFIMDNLSSFSKSSYGEKNVNHERRNVNAMKKNIEEVNSSRYEPANCFRFSNPSPHIAFRSRVRPSSCFSISTTTSAPGINNNLSSVSKAKTPTPVCSHITRNSLRHAC